VKLVTGVQTCALPILALALLLPALFFFLLLLLEPVAFPPLEAVIRPEGHLSLLAARRSNPYRLVGGPPREPCLRNQTLFEVSVSTRVLCLAIHASASASVAKLLTVVG